MGFFDDYGEGAGGLADAGLNAFRGVMDYRMAMSQHKFNQGMQQREQQLREQEAKMREQEFTTKQNLTKLQTQAAQDELTRGQKELATETNARKLLDGLTVPKTTAKPYSPSGGGIEPTKATAPRDKGFGMSQEQTILDNDYLKNQDIQGLENIQNLYMEAGRPVPTRITNLIAEKSLTERQKVDRDIEKGIRLAEEARIKVQAGKKLTEKDKIDVQKAASSMALEILTGQSGLSDAQKTANMKAALDGRPLPYPPQGFSKQGFDELTADLLDEWMPDVPEAVGNKVNGVKRPSKWDKYRIE